MFHEACLVFLFFQQNHKAFQQSLRHECVLGIWWCNWICFLLCWSTLNFTPQEELFCEWLFCVPITIDKTPSPREMLLALGSRKFRGHASQISVAVTNTRVKKTDRENCLSWPMVSRKSSLADWSSWLGTMNACHGEWAWLSRDRERGRGRVWVNYMIHVNAPMTQRLLTWLCILKFTLLLIMQGWIQDLPHRRLWGHSRCR